MTRARAVTQLALIPTTVSDMPGWVTARWERADGSQGEVIVSCLPTKGRRWRIERLWLEAPTSEKLRDVPLARIEAGINAARPNIHEWLEQRLPEPIRVERKRRLGGERRKLSRPASRKLSAAFYQEVAACYKAALEAGLPPTRTLAEDSDTPPGTVNRWIATARNDYGYLPPAEPGKAVA
jgi:hypothetical protein